MIKVCKNSLDIVVWIYHIFDNDDYRTDDGLEAWGLDELSTPAAFYPFKRWNPGLSLHGDGYKCKD